MKGSTQSATAVLVTQLALFFGVSTGPILLSTTAMANTSGTVELQPAEDEKGRTQAEIDALNKKMSQARSKLKELNRFASKTEQQLGQAQKALSENQRQKRHLVTAMEKLEADMKTTRKDIKATRSQLRQHKAWVEEQLVRQYKYGQANGLKLVLSGESPSDTARLIRYHQNIHQSRSERMNEIQRQQSHLTGLRSQQKTSQSLLSEKQAALEKARKKQSVLQQQLLASKKKAEQSISNTSSSLSSMRKQTQILEGLLQDLIVQEELTQSKKEGAFSQLKGKLPQPLAGSLKNVYNQTKHNGNGRWRGAWILPPKNLGQEVEVRSVAPGHIVYTDWLLGYGLLTIIDHGQGFFTLYGHSQTLLRAPGDYVAAGTPIALIRATDQSSKGLYFEIRENSQALNPVAWLNIR